MMRQTKQRPARIQLNGSEIQLNCTSVCVCVRAQLFDYICDHC